MKVIVGLGNPGTEYSKTRHNAGWMAIDALASSVGAGRFRQEGPVEVSESLLECGKVYLVKPQKYMNCSGQALAGWLGRFREIRQAVRETESEQSPKAPEGSVSCQWPGLMIVSDEVHLPLGQLRLRAGGSAGGHNGLKDIEKALGGQGYPRLRLGVGEPPEYMDRVDYVLGRFLPSEVEAAGAMAAKAAEVLVRWANCGLLAAQACCSQNKA